MCGIAGIVSTRYRSAINPMTDALTHRGPDGVGYYTDGSIAMGHRRLSIIDIDGGKQPIPSSDGRLQLICNGEIYNSPEIRRRYEREGYAFRTHTDVEVILPLYLEHGPDCVKHLQGMFAVAIWDTRDNSLFLARDHLGQKPLFYAKTGGDFLFASEVKSIVASGLIDSQPDIEALWHYISLRYVPDDHSLIRGIKKLGAGQCATLREGDLNIHRYWDLHYSPKNTASETQLTDELDGLLNDTVKAHLLSDVEVGSCLSGGIDSTTIAALANKYQGSPLQTFSIGVKDQTFNELPYARMAATHCGFNAHEKVVEADLVRMMPEMIYAMDEPSDPFGVGVHLVSNLASSNVKVVLSGDGGDESFAGYDRYAGHRLADYYCLLPESFRKHVMTRLVKLIPETFGYKTYAQKFKWLNDMSFHTSGARYAHSMSFLRFTEEGQHSLFTTSSLQQLSGTQSADKIIEHFDATNATDLVDRMLYTDLMTRIPDHLLTIADRMSMAFSLEMRPVLVDYKLVEFAARLPSSMKLRGRELKYLLKKVALRYLPEPLINREKQGFSFPIARWLRSDLRIFTERLFSKSRFVEAGIFNPDYMQILLNEHLDGKADHNYRLWILINLEIWYRMYFDGHSVEEMQGFTEELLYA